MLLLLMVVAATTVLTVGLVPRGDRPAVREHSLRRLDQTSSPVSPPHRLHSSGTTGLASLEALIDAPGVVDHSGPYPVTQAEVDAHGVTQGHGCRARHRAGVGRPAAADAGQLGG